MVTRTCALGTVSGRRFGQKEGVELRTDAPNGCLWPLVRTVVQRHRLDALSGPHLDPWPVMGAVEGTSQAGCGVTTGLEDFSGALGVVSGRRHYF